jgi:hypothetical protein
MREYVRTGAFAIQQYVIGMSRFAETVTITAIRLWKEFLGRNGDWKR